MQINLLELFKMGVDYGLLLAEQERDNEDITDAFQGVIIDERYSMPANTPPRRLPRSDEWRNAKSESLYKALEIIGKAKENKELIFIET